MLEQVQDDLWVAEGSIVSFFGAPYPTRCVIARLQDGGLWVWSPVALTAALRGAVDRLGPVRHLVSPNKLHHLYLREWKATYPEASLWGPASTIRKCAGLPFRAALEDAPPPEWQGDIDQAWFRGSFAMDEIVFLHRTSGTVMVADLIQAFSDAFLKRHWGFWRFAARLDGLGQRDPGAPREWRLSFLNRAPARAARAKVLDWNCERVVIAHGDWPRTGGHAFLERALRWLG